MSDADRTKFFHSLYESCTVTGMNEAEHVGGHAPWPMTWGDGPCVEGEVLRCTVPVVGYEYDDEDILRNTAPEPCDTEVYLTWAFTVPVLPREVITAHTVANAAISSSWRLECSGGHVLADSQDGNDYPVPFDPTVMTPKWTWPAASSTEEGS